jgi:hypothetical protein
MDPRAVPSLLSGPEPHLHAIADLETGYGHLTLVPEPAGSRGYDDLRRGASREPLGSGLRVSIAAAGDLVPTLDGLQRPGDERRIDALRHIVEFERSLGLER